MGFELPNGKTARNIQEQVKFLSEKLKELIAFVNQAGLKSIQIVEELPEVGDPSVLYLLAKEDPQTGDYYDEYLWIDDAWELIGTTQIDLSDYVTLSTDQTITGEKTFIDQINLNNNSAESQGKITYNEYSRMNFYIGSTAVLDVRGTGAVLRGSFLPTFNNSYDLGSSLLNWKDLYLSGSAKFGSRFDIQSTVDDYVLTIHYNNQNLINISNVDFCPNYYALDLGTASNKWKDLYLSGNLNIGSGRIWYNNSLFVNDDFCPSSNLVSLGKSTNKWKDAYLEGNIFALEARVNYVGISGQYLNVKGTVAPDTGNSYDIGIQSRQFKDLYLSGNLTDGTNSVSIASLAALSGAHLYKHTIACDNDVITIINNSNTALNTVSNIVAAFPTAVRFLFFYNAGDAAHTNVISVGQDSVQIVDNGSITYLSIDNYDSIVDTVSAYN